MSLLIKEKNKNFASFCPFFLCSLFFVLCSLFTSCENPFSNNLGEKVVVEPPTINIDYPVSGAYLNNIVTFRGQAKAYFEVRKVEVYIYENEDNGQRKIDWTDKGIVLTGSVKNKTWTYQFNTKDYNSGNDGVIRMKFRVFDNKAVEESVELIYIIKNLPSDIRMTTPDSVRITDPLSVSKINYGGEIQGQIIDRRGLKPGYPQIKFWPADEEEPDGEDGWASMFLPGMGSAEAGYDDLQKKNDSRSAGPGVYANRYRMPVVRAAQFSFLLAEHVVEPDPNNPELRRIKYTVENGEHKPLQSGRSYYFRIRSRDTASDPNNKNFPVDDGLYIEGFFPPAGFGTMDEDCFSSRLEPVKILIVSVDTRPTIELNNDDKTLNELGNKPNIYITEPTTKKIAVGRTGRDDFRLRILVTHPDGIERTTLQYLHESSGRTGFLKWDNTINGLGYFDNANDVTRSRKGYYGELFDPGDPGKGKLFTFTADGDLKEIDSTNPEYNRKIFISNSEPYTLIVNVYPQGVADDVSASTSARYVLYMDGVGPNVSIRSVRGAAAEPNGAAEDYSGGMKNDNHYTVNGNIHVVVDRTDDSGIMAHSASMGGAQPPIAAYPMVKWFVEEDKTGYLTATDTMLQKLKDFRNTPTQANLSFFNSIVNTRTSGWVKIPTTDPNADDADKAHNFKFNTFSGVSGGANQWNKKYLWLYVIAQDGVQNLGFIMQKIYVDDDSDLPELAIPTLSAVNAGGAAINGPEGLDVAVAADRAMTGNWSTASPKKNILERDQGIELNFLDDDGINLDSGGVSIILTDLNVPAAPNSPATLSAAQVKRALAAGNKKDMSGVLSQAIMAEALYGADSKITQLSDGMYKIEINVTDDVNEKVTIVPDGYPGGPGDTPSTATTRAVYHFAVFTELPQIIVDNVEENSLQNDTNFTIEGQVKSRLKAQRLWITFNPDVISDPASLTPRTDQLTLYANKAYTLPLSEATPDADGYYTYYWKQDSVVFNPDGLFTGVPVEEQFEWRRFSLEAYDRLGNVSNLQRQVQIDTTGPDVVLIDYNHSRPPDDKDGKVYLYGKVPFIVSASDANGLMETDTYSGIKWWVLRDGVAPPDWGTDYPPYGSAPQWTGGGNFLISQSKSGGRYTGVIDTRKLEDGAVYKLYIIAMDKAGNPSTNAAYETFTVEQSRDYPAIDGNSLNPLQNSVKGRAGLYISGTVSDADLFDPEKLNSYLQIRFPKSTTGTPTVEADWGAWITIPMSTIQSTNKPTLYLDSSGAIVFTFLLDDPALSGSYFHTYFSGDGTKHYQIRVTDEPVIGANGKNYGKNPDIELKDSPGYNYVEHGAVSKIFPSDTGSYQFLVDATPPVIYFSRYDPTAGHDNYSTFRPTFSKWQQLRDILGGTVTEAHLSTLSFSYDEKSKIIITIENPDLPYVPGTTHPWSILNQSDAADLLSPFISMPQGPQNIVMEAIDVAGLLDRVSWVFYKDTQGPQIATTNISRSVKHDPAATPLVSAFPADWPSDWPSEEPDAKWLAWGSGWKTTIAAWPSDYAFFTGNTVADKANKVIAALTAENNRAISVASGDPESASGTQGYNPPVIRGTFDDELSFVWNVDNDGKPIATSFQYRFRDKAGNPTNGAWISKQLVPLESGHKNSSANWEIILNNVGTNGFTGVDGENWFDIRVEDSAHNWSYVYGIRFLVDRANPGLSDTDDFIVVETTTSTNKALKKHERVFSGTGAATDAVAFTVSGRINDYNLSNLQITIGQESSTLNPYTVVASLAIDPLSTVLSNTLSPGSSGTGVVDAPDDQRTSLGVTGADTGVKRLKLAGPYNPGTTTVYNLTNSPPEWVWTLQILQKDIAGLRAAAGPGVADSARRYISIIATDKARRRTGPVYWDFNLDTKKPVIQYITLDKGREGTSFDNNVTLPGIVSDDTKIRDVKYMIGKWVYSENSGNGAWRWWNGTGWTLTAPPTNLTSTPHSSWPSAFAGLGKDPDNPDDWQTSMNWEITQATLNNAAASTFPAGLFTAAEHEGQYRIDLYVTDWSLGNGNFHDTTNGDNTETDGFKDNGYDQSIQTTSASARVFFIDKSPPFLEWVTATNSTTYFTNKNGQVSFDFRTGDQNTIKKWEVVIKDESGELLEYGAIKWEAGTSKGTTSISKPIPSPGIDPLLTSVDPPQTKTIAPFMTTNGEASGGTDLDLVGDTPANPALPKTYTITLTVIDGAKKSNSIQKQFILDNKPPEFDNLRPTSYKFGTAGAPPSDGSYEANAGKMNVRGNTTDNSNQLKRVAFYLHEVGTTYPYTLNFPQPADVLAGAWHWHDPSSTYNIAINGTPVIEIGEGTFAWELRLPQTSLFLNDANAKKYVQWTKTGGLPITGGIVEATPGSYRDVAFTYNSATKVTTAATSDGTVPKLTFQDLMKNDPNDKTIYGYEDVGLITVYMLAEDMAGNITYQALKYWIWPEGDRPQVISINNPDRNKIQAERLLNGSIRLSGMAMDNENVKYVWFRVLPSKTVGGVTTITGPAYTFKEIPRWDENWEAVKTTPLYQTAVDGSTIGDRRSDDPLGTHTGGWYMANGGGSKSVAWWVYINTQGELDPEGLDANEITIEVRAQDVTWDDSKNNNQGGWKDYSGSYRGFASAMSDVSWVTAWVVAGAPIFDEVKVANARSADPVPVWQPIETTSIKGRSSYRVTVKHNSGISAIRWSPTTWTVALNSGAGGFQADPGAESFNLLTMNDGEYVYRDSAGVYHTVTQSAAFAALGDGTNPLNPNPATRMAVTVQPRGKKVSGDTLTAGKSYMIWKWDIALEKPGLFVHNDSHNDPPTPTGAHKDMKYTIIIPTVTGAYATGSAVLIESDPETVNDKEYDYYKWDVFVDVRADVLLSDLEAKDPSYGAKGPDGKPLTGREGQTRGSVRYPVYLSATEVSKATPLTIRGDTLLPIDTLPPKAAYTLNRRPAGIAATIGGEAGDDGPVNGVARVVLWFEQDGQFISWHKEHEDGVTPLPAGGAFVDYTNGSGPVWWDSVSVGAGGVIPAGVRKPSIPAENVTGAANGVGSNAIVIDRNSPSVGQESWGHKLPMGFADGGMGKYWYVEINSFGIKSGPVYLHYVVIDKAGNAKYYRERLVIMNNAPVISNIKLATDIRDNSAMKGAAPLSTNNRVGRSGVTYPATPGGAEANGRNTILQAVWNGVQLGGDNWVKRGITEDISSSALGVGRIIDFNVRNKLFALRVETTNGPGLGKTRNFRLEYVSSARLMSNTAAAGQRLTDITAGRIYIINEPGTARWGIVGAEGDGPWPRGYAFLAAVNGQAEAGEGERFNDGDTGSVWELNYGYRAIGQRTDTSVPGALQLGDVEYALNPGGINQDAKSAEFVYSTGAFGTNAGNSIIDYGGSDDLEFPLAANNDPSRIHSMFILRVFDGPEADTFGDFTIIRVRVNNDDRTKPFAQIYDINPKTEGQDRQNIAENEQERSLTPMFIGEGTGSNRTKGGLWNIAPATGSVAKPGHIEPRRMNGNGYGSLYTATQSGESMARNHSLSSAQMGGAAITEDATITKPFADPAGFFTADTVSGQVVLRGYAEDDQRIQRVELRIGGDANPITILEYQAHAASGDGYGTAGSSANYKPPKTGLLRVPTALAGNSPKVHFTDSIDLYRHRVEWAYIWDTEAIPANTVAGDVSVRVVSYNRDRDTTDVKTASDNIAAPGQAHSNTSDLTKPNTSPYNPGFQVGLNKYNSITMNLRPYITGFLRNKAQFSNNTRSRQGRYMFYRGEIAVVTGFNLSGGSTTNPIINLPVAGDITTVNVGSAGGTAIGDFGITTANNSRYRQFTVTDASAATGNGVVAYRVTGGGQARYAVNTYNGTANTGAERKITAATTTTPIRPTYIMPWNIERSAGVDGSDLWDDFTQVHIWQSNGTNTGADRGIFPKGTNLEVFDPSMSIDPATGTLWSGHNEGGGNGFNTGTTKVGNNNGAGSLVVAAFVDPIISSDIFISARPSGYNGNNLAYTVWTSYSLIGRSGSTSTWKEYGGVLISGPQGGRGNNNGNPSDGNPITTTTNPYQLQQLNSGVAVSGQTNNGFNAAESVSARSQYLAESTGYNAGTNTGTTNANTGVTTYVNWPPGNATDPPSRNQFKNTHIVTYYDTSEHIHVSYYDTKDGSLKYRYNRRGEPGIIYADNQATNTAHTVNKMPYAWTNLDGGWDEDDQNAFNADNNDGWNGGTGGGWYRAPFSNFTGTIARNGRIVNQGSRPGPGPDVVGAVDAGEYNAIALTSQGYPVVAYYDKTNQKLKMAVSNATVPIAASAWRIIDNVIPTGNMNHIGTGEYVSLAIDTRTGDDQNTVHIAALNSTNKNLVYIKGKLTGQTWTFISARVVDSVGSVGRWCNISLDSSGNPWIGYQDESYQGSRDGVKLAYYNASRFYKGRTYFSGQDTDVNGDSVDGWEAMHVPTQFQVDNARVGMECYPALRLGYTGTPQPKFWEGAVGYLGQDYFRVAYYVK